MTSRPVGAGGAFTQVWPLHSLSYSLGSVIETEAENVSMTDPMLYNGQLGKSIDPSQVYNEKHMNSFI